MGWVTASGHLTVIWGSTLEFAGAEPGQRSLKCSMALMNASISLHFPRVIFLFEDYYVVVIVLHALENALTLYKAHYIKMLPCYPGTLSFYVLNNPKN